MLRLFFVLALAVAWREADQPAALTPVEPAGATEADGGVCDLCARDFVIVLATGRSGSTSLLETLNSLPGLSLRGENHATIWSAYDMYQRSVADGPSESHLPSYEHGPLSTQRLLCELQDFFEAFDPQAARWQGEQVVMHGFKELILPSDTAAMKAPLIDRVEQSPQHLDGDAMDGWMKFVLELFPCARIIFNYRRDTVAQANASFHQRDGATPQWLDAMTTTMRSWHERISNSSASSYLFALEDLSPVEATRMAHWLGFETCTFHALPHANDPAFLNASDPSIGTPGHTSQFHQDYEHVDLACAAADKLRIPARPTRFYLHEDLGAPFRSVELQARMLLARSDTDEQLPVTMAEHMTDLYLLDALRHHPQRTLNETDADVHFTSALIGMSALLTMHEWPQARRERANGTVHWERVSAFAELLAQKTSFKEGKVFYIQMSLPSSYYPPFTMQCGDPLLAMLKAAPHARVVLGTTDPAYIGQRSALMNGLFQRYSVLPYRANAMLSSRQTTSAAPRTRSIDIFFSGNTRRRDLDLRASMLRTVELVRTLRNVVGLNQTITGSSANWSESTYQAAATEIIRRSARQMQDADICLCPAGDTATSRRLFDALAAKCVPVIVVKSGRGFFKHIASPANSSQQSLAQHARRFLPFAELIDWSRIAFFWHISSEEEGTRLLLDISSPQRVAQRERMRARGRRVFDKYLNVEYQAEAVVSAILKTEAAKAASLVATDTTFEAQPSRMAHVAPPQCLAYDGRPSGGRAVFIRTSDNASSGIFGILANAAVHMGLNVALPQTESHSFGWPESFPDGNNELRGPNERYLREQRPFDVLLHHASLAPRAMAEAVPNAPFVTILSDPADQFVTAWDQHWGGGERFGFDVSTDSHGHESNATLVLADNTTETLPIRTWTERAAFVSRVDELGINSAVSKLLVNPAAKQLGWSRRAPNGTASTTVAEWLATVGNLFSLVMLHERLDESLLLLGRCLGLEPQDLVPRPISDVGMPGGHLTSEDRSAIYKLSHVDRQLHEYAQNRMDRQLHETSATETGRRALNSARPITRLSGLTLLATSSTTSQPVAPWWKSMPAEVDEIRAEALARARNCKLLHVAGRIEGTTSPTRCNMWQWSDAKFTSYLANRNGALGRAP